MGDAGNGGVSWAFGLFTNKLVDTVFGSKASRVSSQPDSAARIEAKRRRSPVMEIDEESPQAKRVRRSPPPGTTSRMQTEPPTNHRRAGSVKALGFNDVHGPGRPRNLLSSMRSEATMASGKSALSHVPRAPSSGLSVYMDRLKMQTPSSPTPGADLQSLARRTAGVSSAAYNVNRAFSPVESTTFRSSVAGSVDLGQGDRMSAQQQVTPTGASFGPTRPAFTRTALSMTREESPPKRPSLDRHADKAPWAGRAGSVRATSRLGDNSLSRLRTTSLISTASNGSYGRSSGPASALAPSVGTSNGRTTPTLRDGHISSPPLTSPEPSVVGSPPHSARSSLPPHAQRALEMRNSASTTLTRTFNGPHYGKIRVPMPSSTGKTSSITSTSISGQQSDSHSRSQSAASVTSVASSKTNTSSKAGSKATAAPYTVGGSKSQGKKILEKRKAEERELDAVNLNSREEMPDLHVEPIKTGKENADPALAKANGPDARSQVGPSTGSPQSQRHLVPPSSVSESNSGTSSKTVKNRPAHTLEKRTRIPEKDVLSRFNPATNERLIKARNAGSGRYSMPPDDDEDTPGVEEMKKIQEKTAPLVLPKDFKIEKFGAGSNAPSGGEAAPSAESTGSDAMNITPVKERYEQEDSPADMMSTTPTESSIKNSFNITPIVKPAEPATSNLFGAAPSSGGTFGGAMPRMGDAFSSQESTTSFSQAAPEAPEVSMSPPEVSSTEVNTASSKFGANSGNLGGPATPTPLPFSFGAPPKVNTPAPSTFSVGSAPTSVPTASSSLLGGLQANDKKSPPPPTVIVTEPPKPISSFFSTPAVTSNSQAAKPSLFGAPAQPSQSAPKPLFSFPTAGTSGVTPAEPKKDVLPPFSFGAPPASTTSDAVTTPVKQPAPFSFGNASTTPATPTTISAGTPSPQKQGFSFPSSSPAPLGTTTPLGTPFTFEGTPSPVRPVPSANDESPTKTPTKTTFSFGAPSTTPLITPTTANNTFSFNKAASTTPAETPAPFSFGASQSASSSAPAPFTFGTTPSAATTTPAAAPPSGGFNFSFGANTDLKNPFHATTPSPTKPFTFGAGAPPVAPSVSSFSFGQSAGDATPTVKPVTGFNFDQSQSNATPTPTPTTTTGFSFGGPASSNAPAPTTNGLLFPSGPRTPLTKVLELDGMDTSPIRGGNTPGGPTFSGSSGSGFSFGTNNNNNNTGGGFASAPTSAAPFGGGNTGFGAPSSSTFGGFARDSSPAPTPSPFGFGGNGTASGAFGHTATSAPPSAGGFGGASGFSLTPISPAVASPFNPPQAFGSPAASPFTLPTTLGGANPFPGPGQRGSVGSGLEFASGGSDAGSAGGEGRKIMPMPKPRRNRTAQEKRSSLQRAHAAGL